MPRYFKLEENGKLDDAVELRHTGWKIIQEFKQACADIGVVATEVSREEYTILRKQLYPIKVIKKNHVQ